MASAKAALRSTMRQRRDAIPADVRRAAAREAAEHVLRLPSLSTARVVGLYAAMGSELSTVPLARALLERGATLAYPRVVPGRRRLDFHRVEDLDELRPATFNIPEPPRDAPRMPLERIELFVVPGLAFDREGMRLGWGAGHYDVTLDRSPRAERVGYAYEIQLVHDVPSIDTDLPMDVLATEAGVHVINPRGAR